MATEENKALARWFEAEVESKGNLAAAEGLLSPSYTLHFAGSPDVDRAGYGPLLTVFRTGFPDMTVTIEEQVAEGDAVANRFTMRGTHTGSFQGIPPTGRSVAISGINIMRIENGKIAEQWGVLDTLGLLQQIGAIPQPQETSV